jgi:ubiquinone/menaquinone biosynthesis C-methylase UbiE
MPLQGRNVLDIGCGDGAFVRELARAGAHVTGLECSEAQLALCRQAAPVADESYLAGVGQALPFPDGLFDAAVFRASLHHVPAGEMTTALREARRATRRGGEIFVFEPLATGPSFELVRLIDDETEVRRLAQQAIARSVVEGWLSRKHSALLTAEVVYSDLDAVRRRLVAIDGARAALFDARRAEIERVFNAGGAATERGRLFTQPFRLDVLE